MIDPFFSKYVGIYIELNAKSCLWRLVFTPLKSAGKKFCIEEIITTDLYLRQLKFYNLWFSFVHEGKINHREASRQGNSKRKLRFIKPDTVPINMQIIGLLKILVVKNMDTLILLKSFSYTYLKMYLNVKRERAILCDNCKRKMDKNEIITQLNSYSWWKTKQKKK